MQQSALEQLAEDERLGQQMHDLASQLFPLHRSLTGEGNRQTLRILGEHLPIVSQEVPTGSQVFDWTIPQEWRINDAFIADEQGHRVVDYRRSNLHVVNGSHPVRTRMSWEELRTKLHTLPQQPDRIPYRTNFFDDGWGFCLAHRDLDKLAAAGVDRRYEVVIDSTYHDGSLTYGEAVLPGRLDQEILIYAHLCHPSLANDNLSGIVVASQLARLLLAVPRHYTFRFVFAPATLGALAWLRQNEHRLSLIEHGLLLTLLGDDAPLRYKRSRLGDAAIDRAAARLYETRRIGTLEEFSPLGYDERQFCSPGFNLPVGRLMRSPPNSFLEYHTSGDNLEFVRANQLLDSLRVCLKLVGMLESNRTYRSRQPKGEPRLGDYGIYRAFGESDDRGRLQEAILWLLNLADGTRDLLAVADRARLPFELVDRAAELLLEHGLIYDTRLAEPTSMK